MSVICNCNRNFYVLRNVQNFPCQKRLPNSNSVNKFGLKRVLKSLYFDRTKKCFEKSSFFSPFGHWLKFPSAFVDVVLIFVFQTWCGCSWCEWVNRLKGLHPLYTEHKWLVFTLNQNIRRISILTTLVFWIKKYILNFRFRQTFPDKLTAISFWFEPG